MKLKGLPILLASMFSFSLLACAGNTSSQKDENLADLTAEMGAESQGAQGDLPKALGGPGTPAPVPQAPKVIELKKSTLALNNGEAWSVDECYSFVIGGIAKASRDYSISGNYDGNRFKSALGKQVKTLTEECPAPKDEPSQAALNQYFNPLKTYIEALTAQAGVKESNTILAYTEDYYKLFQMGE